MKGGGEQCLDCGKVLRAVLRQNGVVAKFLGSFSKELRRVLVKNGEERLFPREADDPYARFLSEKL